MHGREIGNYQITNFLGRGRAGEVFRAVRRDDPSQRVALKAVYANGSGTGTLAAELERLLGELKKLEHPNILSYHDLLVADDACFLVMDYLNSNPLGRLVEPDGIIPVQHALGLFQQTVEAVAHAHSRGLVHGGLSGQQVLYATGEKLQVTDFGLRPIVGARAREPADEPYAAPELAAGERPADAQSDVYALGILLFHLLVGGPPSAAGNDGAPAIVDQLRERRPDLQEFVVELVARTTAQDPAERPSAAELAQTLRVEHSAADGPLVAIARRRRAASSPASAEGVEPEPEMVLIPTGEFVLGSSWGLNEQPMKTLELAAYEIGKFPVSNGLYRVFCDRSGKQYPRDPAGWEGYFTDYPDHPVLHVDWHGAAAYCAWLAETTGKPYRLPSEAEWEKAAKGGLEGKKYPWGDEDPDGRALYADRAHPWRPFDSTIQTVAVGSFPANGYGLHDLAGLVWEWCDSWYFRYDAEEKRRRRGIYKVVRGGSWGSDADCLRSSYRMSFGPDYWDSYLGFRCACSVAT